MRQLSLYNCSLEAPQRLPPFCWNNNVPLLIQQNVLLTLFQQKRFFFYLHSNLLYLLKENFLLGYNCFYSKRKKKKKTKLPISVNELPIMTFLLYRNSFIKAYREGKPPPPPFKWLLLVTHEWFNSAIINHSGLIVFNLSQCVLLFLN